MLKAFPLLLLFIGNGYSFLTPKNVRFSFQKCTTSTITKQELLFASRSDEEKEQNEESLNNNDEGGDIFRAEPYIDSEVEGKITREMFLKEMLEEDPSAASVGTDEGKHRTTTSDDENGDDEANNKNNDERETALEAIVKRKKRKSQKYSSYRVVDNRDSLPFEVRMMNPDPYTPGSQAKMQEKQQRGKQQQQTNKSNLNRPNKIVKRTNLSKSQEGIAADIYAETDDGELTKVLGHFQLDKSTNCGDLIEVGDRNFQVQRARCQYKYAGGQKFVMVRKILEVKEITRIAQENSLMRQFNDSTLKGSNNTGGISPLEH